MNIPWGEILKLGLQLAGLGVDALRDRERRERRLALVRAQARIVNQKLSLRVRTPQAGDRQ